MSPVAMYVVLSYGVSIFEKAEALGKDVLGGSTKWQFNNLVSKIKRMDPFFFFTKNTPRAPFSS